MFLRQNFDECANGIRYRHRHRRRKKIVKNSFINLKLILFVFIIFNIGCNSSHKLLKRADDSGNYGSLKTIALKQLQKNPKDSYAIFMLGKVYLIEGKPDSAVFYSTQAVELEPLKSDYRTGLIESKLTLGDTLLKNGSLGEARKNYQFVVELDSKHFLGLCRLGLVQRKIGRYDEAKENYRKAFRINTRADSLQGVLDFFDAAHVQSNLLMKKGRDLLNQKKYQDAMETMEKSVAAKPDNKDAKYYSYLANGLYYYKRGSVGKLWDAIEMFGLAISLRPDQHEPHFYIAEAYIKKDKQDFENSISEFQEVLKLSQDSDLAKEAKKRIEELKARQKLLQDFWNKKK